MKRFATSLVVVVLVLGGSAAFAAIPGPDGVIHACMLKGVGTIRIIDPEESGDLLGLAGVDGALHGYEAIHKKDISYRLPHLDDLIQKRDQGKLTDYVHATTKKCK